MTPTDDRPDPGDPGDEDRPVNVEDLIALRDGDLDDEQARRVAERIERDPQTTAALLDELDQTDAILDQLRNRPPPPDLSDQLQAAIAREAARAATDHRNGADQTRDDQHRADQSGTGQGDTGQGDQGGTENGDPGDEGDGPRRGDPGR